MSGLAVVLAALFIAFPAIDLAASGLFFQPGSGFLMDRDSPWLALPYRGLPRLGQLTVLLLAVLWIASFIPRLNRLRPRRTLFGFLLAAAIIGPVLIVDIGLKDHSGRARPVNVQPFGGAKTFTPAFIPADQCRKNCSFVSGHVATASFLMAFGWLAAPAVRRRWLLGGVAAAGFFGLVRMAPGGHFLSDVLFGFFAVYFSLWLTEWLFRLAGWLPRPAPSATDAA